MFSTIMKKILPLLVLLICSARTFSQTYGNEWINYSQRYYRFKVWKTGVYKLTPTDLQAAGIPLSSFQTPNIQIFGRQREIPIYVQDGGDNTLDPGDFILFYAQRNDGWLDSAMYVSPTDMSDPNYSLINDTINYFFTWNSSASNKRFIYQNDTDFSGFTPVNFVEKEVSPPDVQNYSPGYIQVSASPSIYARGEGYGFWWEAIHGVDNEDLIPVPTPNVYSGADGSAVTLHISCSQINDPVTTYCSDCDDRHLRLDIGTSNYLLFDTVFHGWHHFKFDRTLPVSVLNNGTTNIGFSQLAVYPDVYDRQMFDYYRLRYPRLTNSNGDNIDQFRVLYNPGQSKSWIHQQNISTVHPIILSFGANPRFIVPSVSGSDYDFFVPNSTPSTQTEVYITEADSVLSVSPLLPVNGTGSFTNFPQNIPDSAVLFIWHPSLATASQAYAAYRSSIPGGGYNVLKANIEELYLQFGGGIEKSPMAVRRFAHFVYNNATQKPQGLFLIGKGIDPVTSRADAQLYAKSLIPPFGYPASDVALTAGLNGTQWEPLIPTGRIAANNETELQNYLDKVQVYESQQTTGSPLNSDYQKQLLHFVGGSNAIEQNLFRARMDTMAAIAERPLYAGNVTSYYKTTSDPLDPAVVTEVTDKISQGVSVMNFFGHAASSNNGFEINVDEASNWNNTGKYPLVIGNSCYNGNIFSTDNSSTSEKTVNIPQEGAIAFISSVEQGFDLPLFDYCKMFYQLFSDSLYGRTMGLQLQRAAKLVQPFDPTRENAIWETAFTQMAFHGDPMLKVNWHKAPEISISEPNVYFTPENLNLAVDSVTMHVIITNLGSAVLDTFELQVIRDFPQSNTDSIYTVRIPRLNYKDTLEIKFPLQASIGIGENIFKVTVDLPSAITEEQDELNNNQVTKPLYLKVDGIYPIWPYDFAVVPIDSVTVKASTIDPILSTPKTYYFELDTTDLYNSPQLRRYQVTEIGGVKEVNPSQWKNASGASFPLVCQDSMVYFWRVAADSSTLVWNEFSFQYIPGKEGWGQDHFFQFKKNDFFTLDYNRPNRDLEYGIVTPHYIEIDAYPSVGSAGGDRWSMDGATQESNLNFFGTPAIYVFVIDPVTNQSWGTHYLTSNPDHSFGNDNDNPSGSCLTCRNRVEHFFSFLQNNPTSLANFSNMITNEIPDSFYVGIYTAPATVYSNWDAMYPAIYDVFTQAGATVVHSGQPEQPFAIFFKKGDPSSIVEKHYPDTSPDIDGQAVQVRDTIIQPQYQGLERSVYIGPSTNWKTIFWKRSSVEAPVTDSVRLRIEGYNWAQNLQVTIDTVFTMNDSLQNVNNILPAAQYPYMRLSIFSSDITNSTPAQIDRLHVLFSPVPEAAIDGSSGAYLSVNTTSLMEGQQVQFAVDVKNVSAYPMDSLLVNYWIEDVNRNKHYIDYTRQDSLRVGQVLRDTISFSTIGYGGFNVLWMEVNPYINGSTVITDQPEQYHFNNILQIPFTVDEDDVNPILDVTFDGRHILNDDIVSPKAEILITLKDNNPYRIMDQVTDTALFGIYLTSPNGIQKRIPFIDGSGNVVMEWLPADAQNMKFRIIWPGDFTQNGKYTLFVQGTDRSGNISGDMEYRISFEVIHKSSITAMMNYPNPFSTSTRFVFTVTGEKPPEEMIIQIMTVTGRVVREITEDEIGRIYIGKNVSQYAWDGKDEFGDQLANGVYLYRVLAKISGEDIEHRDSGADQYMKKNYGKMYLLR